MFRETSTKIRTKNDIKKETQQISKLVHFIIEKKNFYRKMIFLKQKKNITKPV